MRLLELLWLVMVIRIRNTRLEMIKVKMVIVKGGVLEDFDFFLLHVATVVMADMGDGVVFTSVSY